MMRNLANNLNGCVGRTLRLLELVRGTHPTVTIFILMMGVSMGALSATATWKEEVLLHDDSKIIVERTVERGGRHEIGQSPPIKEQSLSFAMPSTGDLVTWKDEFSEDVGGANFLAMQLEILKGTVYLVASPMGCLSYNKWGRLNPPYVVFKYQNKEWWRITLQELPTEFKTPNLVISSPDDAAKQASQGLVSAEKVKELNTGFRQPEYQTILRESVKHEGPEGCPELVRIRGGWASPDGAKSPIPIRPRNTNVDKKD